MTTTPNAKAFIEKLLKWLDSDAYTYDEYNPAASVTEFINQHRSEWE